MNTNTSKYKTRQTSQNKNNFVTNKEGIEFYSRVNKYQMNIKTAQGRKQFIVRGKKNNKGRRKQLTGKKKRGIINNYPSILNDHIDRETKEKERLDKKLNLNFNSEFNFSEEVKEKGVDLDNIIILSKPQVMKGYFKYAQKHHMKNNSKNNFFQSSSQEENQTSMNRRQNQSN